jgi:hypothetical protein
MATTVFGHNTQQDPGIVAYETGKMHWRAAKTLDIARHFEAVLDAPGSLLDNLTDSKQYRRLMERIQDFNAVELYLTRADGADAIPHPAHLLPARFARPNAIEANRKTAETLWQLAQEKGNVMKSALETHDSPPRSRLKILTASEDNAARFADANQKIKALETSPKREPAHSR